MDEFKKLRIGALLPHVKLYGGIKRFFELGNQFVDLGHDFTAFTTEGEGQLGSTLKASLNQLRN